MSTIWTLAKKDLRLFVRDRTGLALGVLLPVGLVFIFGFIMSNVGGGDDALPDIELWVADLDDSEASRALVAALQQGGMFDVRLPQAPARFTRDDLVAEIKDGETPLALAIPAGFGAGSVDLELIVDPGRDLEQRMASMGLMQALFEAQGPDVAWRMTERALLQSGLPPEFAARVRSITTSFQSGIESMFADASGGEPADEDDVDMAALMEKMLPIQRTEVLPEGREQRITYMVSHSVSGMTVMMLMFSLVGMGRSLIEERDKGALKRLLALPIDPRAILVSKFLSTWIVGVGLVCVLFTFASFVFDLEILPRWDTLLVFSLATAAASTAFATLIASWAKTEKQADGVSTLLILLMAPIGGCWMPLMFMPEQVQQAARFTLPYWSLVGFQGSFWSGKHWTEPSMLQALGVLLGITLGLTLLATLVFRRRFLRG